MKNLLFALLALAMVVSCTKDDATSNDTVLTEISLSASIGDLTRSSYVDSEGILKMTWDADEKISIVKCEVGGIIVGVYNLTSTGTAGRENAVFTGSVDTSGGEDYKYFAVFPAVEEVETGQYAATAPTGDFVNNIDIRATSGILSYITSTFTYTPQETINPTEHLKYYDLMYGEVTMNGNTANTTLVKQTSIFKFVLTLPAQEGDNADIIDQLKITSSYQYAELYKNAWFNTSYGSFGDGNCQNSRNMHIGINTAGYKVPSDKRTITLYMPVINDVTFAKDSEITINLYNDSQEIFTTTKTVNADATLKKGRVHTFTATMDRVAVAE